MTQREKAHREAVVGSVLVLALGFFIAFHLINDIYAWATQP